MNFLDEVNEGAAFFEQGLLPPHQNFLLIGHQAVEQKLLQDYQSGRMPHALIFAGPEGVGKATLAYRLARFLLAEGGEAEDSLFGDAAPPTNLFVSADNPVSKRIASGGHADFRAIQREFDEKKGRLKAGISVDEVRKINPFLHRTAAEGGWRVVIIDGAEHLNRNSQNAILKILEEPPPKTLLILVTNQPGGFLPTIRSRCRLYSFGSLEASDVILLLEKAHPDMTRDEKNMLSGLSEGSVGYAMRLFDEGGAELYQQLFNHFKILPEMDWPKVHELSEKLGRTGAEQSYQTTMELFIYWLQRYIRFQGRGAEMPVIVQEERHVMTHFMAHFPGQKMVQLWEDVAGIYQKTARHNLDRRQAVLETFGKIAP